MDEPLKFAPATELEKTNLKLHEVQAIHKTVEPGVFHIMCKITDFEGQTYDALHVLRPEDPYGLSPTIRKWIADHPAFPVQDYVPPTQEEIRRNTKRIDRPTFRLNMKEQGVGTAKIEDFLASIADPSAREDMQIRWEGAHFGRLDPFVVDLGAATGMSEWQLDAVFKVGA
jgi:hypothetical protein